MANIAWFRRSRRATALTAVGVVAALGVSGWALAEGDLPLVSSTSPDSSTAGGSSGSPGAGTDNVAVATNTKDGTQVFALALKVVQTDSENVDPVNAAVAMASCEDCQTVAIALEAVLVAGEASNFEPTNVALALNAGCTNCQTLAAAHQQVVQNDGRVRITGAGRREIADIRTDLLSLRNSGLDVVAIYQRVNEAAGRLTEVLQTQVVPIGRPADAGRRPSAPDSTTSTSAAPGTSVPVSTTASAPEPTTTTTTTTTSPTTTTVAP